MQYLLVKVLFFKCKSVLTDLSRHGRIFTEYKIGLLVWERKC